MIIEELSNASLQFKNQSKGVNRSIWWKNMKWNIILGTTALIITGGIVAYFVAGPPAANKDAQANQPPPAAAPPA